jgi:hypothetical protein
MSDGKTDHPVQAPLDANGNPNSVPPTDSELARLRAQVASLEGELAKASRERDGYKDFLYDVLFELMPAEPLLEIPEERGTPVMEVLEEFERQLREESDATRGV